MQMLVAAASPACSARAGPCPASTVSSALTSIWTRRPPPERWSRWPRRSTTSSQGYASIHRGAGWRSRLSTAAYEQARQAIAHFAGRERSDDVAVICRTTTEAINHLAFRLDLAPDDVVVTTVVEHHANLLP